MIEYCCGFMIVPDTRRVLCIRKNRPADQMGKWNGIGGKLEPGETPLQAQVREFREETSIVTEARDWEHTITLRGCDFAVHYFRAFVNEMPFYRSVTDEWVMDWDYHDLRRQDVPTLENFQWILPIQFSLNLRFPILLEWQRLS